MKGCMSLDLICITHQIIAAAITTCKTSGAWTTMRRATASTVAGQQMEDVTRGDQRESGGISRHDLRNHRALKL